jgi:hypothetical protein
VPRQKLFVSKRRLRKQKSQPQKTVLGSIIGEDSFSSSETKQDRMVQRTKLFLLVRKLQELRSQTQTLGLSLSEDVGFRNNNNNFYDIQQYVSNDQAYGKLSDNKD